ncbi:peptidyl-prolyl cis-trans isomerase, partial [Klebsiella pneumoniae]|nr:peptidyl-prolyl cis-trans isomerase [Klebsiella pneumoniae]
QKLVATLNKSGQVSEPFRTNEGLALLKVTGFKEAMAQPYDQVKAKVQDAYSKQQAEEQFGDVREKLASLTYEHPESL